MRENTSVEELLKTLRQSIDQKNLETQASSATTSETKILELTQPIKRESYNPEDSAVQFISDMVEKVLNKILLEDKNIIKEAVSKTLSSSDEIKNIIKTTFKEQVDQQSTLEPLIKEIVEQNLSKILRS